MFCANCFGNHHAAIAIDASTDANLGALPLRVFHPTKWYYMTMIT